MSQYLKQKHMKQSTKWFCEYQTGQPGQGKTRQLNIGVTHGGQNIKKFKSLTVPCVGT